MFVKICGTTTEEDALLAVAMGADAVGFIFAPGSTRQITADRARDIARRLPPEILTIGVFRDQAPERVVDVVHFAGLRGAQLHGHETVEEAQLVRKQVQFLIQAFGAGDPAVERATEYPADAIMIDSPTPGSGKVFDWSLTEGVPSNARLILAGGLTPENVAGAIGQVKPWGVDCATGVESEPGRKDPRKVRAFVANAKAAAPREYEAGDEVAPYDWQDDG
jgi:phosphoribosylanthranilate isomerase